MINLPQETEASAHRLAVAHKLSAAQAIRLAPEEQARAEGLGTAPRRPRDLSSEAIAARSERIDAIVREVAVLPILDPRSLKTQISAKAGHCVKTRRLSAVSRRSSRAV